MSLEEALTANTAAVIALTAAMGKAPKGKGKDTTESTQPAASTATPAATAPAAGQQAQSPAASATVATAGDPALLAKTTEAVIKLANEYSREKAVGILAKRKVTRCSDLKPEELQPVLTEANTEIAAAEAAKVAATANASLV